MKLLAIDTATEGCSVALGVDGQVLARFEHVGRSHTERLMPMVLALMAEAGLSFRQLDGYACDIGPGSFAGIRIGVGFVKGLALAVERPVAAVSSLAALALPALRSGAAAQVVAVIDARMDEVYVGCYRADDAGLPRPIGPERVCAPAVVPELGPGDWVGVGGGWARYGVVLRAACRHPLLAVLPEALPQAQDVLAIGAPLIAAGHGIGADALAPAYLRDKVALTIPEQQALRGS